MLSFSSDAYGITSSPAQLFRLERRFLSNGAFYRYDDFNLSVLRHHRSNKTSNRRRLLSGTSTLWIPPSSYSRAQFIIAHNGVGSYKSFPGQYINDSVLPASYAQSSWPSIPSGERISWYQGIGYGDFPDSNSLYLSNARNMANTKALNDLASAKASLGEALATSRQTAEMFVENATRLLNFVRRARSGRLLWELRHFNVQKLAHAVRSGKVSDRVASRWLEFHYGWRPLASDVYGTWELLKESLNGPALLVHGRGSSRINGKGFSTTNAIGNNPSMDFVYSADLAIRVNLTGKVQSSPILRSVNQAGLVNPLALGWELIPFSFVVDWILPVGSVLTALTATAGLDFVGGHRTERFKRHTRVTVNSRDLLSRESPAVSFEAFGFTRYALGSFPLPAPYIRPLYTGSDRIATILALINNLFQSWKR